MHHMGVVDSRGRRFSRRSSDASFFPLALAYSHLHPLFRPPRDGTLLRGGNAAAHTANERGSAGRRDGRREDPPAQKLLHPAIDCGEASCIHSGLLAHWTHLPPGQQLLLYLAGEGMNGWPVRTCASVAARGKCPCGLVRMGRWPTPRAFGPIVVSNVVTAQERWSRRFDSIRLNWPGQATELRPAIALIGRGADRRLGWRLSWQGAGDRRPSGSSHCRAVAPNWAGVTTDPSDIRWRWTWGELERRPLQWPAERGPRERRARRGAGRVEEEEEDAQEARRPVTTWRNPPSSAATAAASSSSSERRG